jgi:hypothetical protein
MNRQSIGTAPKDGRKVTVYWTDGDGVENESVAQYRASGSGGWDAADAGWWAYVDSDTQKRISPHSWRPQDAEDEE